MNKQVRHIEPKSPVLFSANDNHTSLIDFSLQSRMGIRGKNAVAQVEKIAISVPEKPNSLTETDEHILVRLINNEFWLLSKSDSQVSSTLETGSGAYPVLCQDSHAWFVLNTHDNAAVLAKLCSVDLRPANFVEGAVAQTVVAGVNAIILHHHYGQQAVFSILCDRSVAQYLWDVLNDVLNHD